MSDLITFNADSPKRSHLPTAGKYFAGQSLTAGDGTPLEVRSCVIENFTMPSTNHERDFLHYPAFDKEGKQGPYALFEFKIVGSPFGLVRVNHHASGKALENILTNLGIDLSHGEGTQRQFTREQAESLVGLECGVEVGDPTTKMKNGEEVTYSGFVKGVFGV